MLPINFQPGTARTAPGGFSPNFSAGAGFGSPLVRGMGATPLSNLIAQRFGPRRAVGQGMRPQPVGFPRPQAPAAASGGQVPLSSLMGGARMF